MRKITQLSLLLVFFTVTVYGQLLAPAVSQISSQQEFVIVIKGTKSVNAKVLMQDGNASSFDFDPNNVNTYPRWKVERVELLRTPAQSLFYYRIKCLDNQLYFAFEQSGDDKMLPKEEYDRLNERDETGKYKHNLNEKYFFTYRVYIADDKQHITLNYEREKSSGTSPVRMKTWPSNYLKLVLVKL